MEPTTFGFSKFVGWSGMLMFTVFLALLVYGGFSSKDVKVWLYMVVPLLIVLGLMLAFAKWCFVPMLQGLITLELDEEKAQCYLAGKTIYWKDVIEISEDYGQYSTGLVFEMVNGEQESLNTKWISGSTTSIRKKMEEYFARTL